MAPLDLQCILTFRENVLRFLIRDGFYHFHKIKHFYTETGVNKTFDFFAVHITQHRSAF